MEIKKPLREVEGKAREFGRELDGHDASDDLGNAGDEIRKDAGNLGDEIRKDAGNLGDDLRRDTDPHRNPEPSDRTEVPRDGAPD